jgi:hypothetical protein
MEDAGVDAGNFKVSSLDFGIIIAFVAPGFVALQAASYYVPTIAQWMTAASEKEQSIGVFMFVLLASLSMGLVVSGVRALVVDKLLRCRLLRKYAVLPLALDWSKVDEKKLPILITIRDAHYRHYQFYSNTLIALVSWMASHGFAGSLGAPWHAPEWALMAVAAVALLLSARQSFRLYVDGVNQLIDP